MPIDVSEQREICAKTDFYAQKLRKVQSGSFMTNQLACELPTLTANDISCSEKYLSYEQNIWSSYYCFEQSNN